MNHRTVTIVLPTFNEAGNIIGLVQALLDTQPAGWDYEILVIDDNSPDGTFDLVRKNFDSHLNVSAFLRTSNRGLARSLREGAERATGDWIVFMDSDFTHDPAALPKLLHTAQEFDIVIGSRFCTGGSMADTPHYLLSLAYNWLIRVVLRTQIQDNLGGYLVIRKTTLQLLPYDNIFFGYGDYCFRLLHMARKLGINIVELPVHFRTRQIGDSKSRFVLLLFFYTFALIKFRVIELWKRTFSILKPAP